MIENVIMLIIAFVVIIVIMYQNNKWIEAEIMSKVKEEEFQEKIKLAYKTKEKSTVINYDMNQLTEKELIELKIKIEKSLKTKKEKPIGAISIVENKSEEGSLSIVEPSQELEKAIQKQEDKIKILESTITNIKEKTKKEMLRKQKLMPCKKCGSFVCVDSYFIDI